MGIAKMTNEDLDGLSVEICKTVRRRESQIIIKLKAPKDYFSLGELLSKYQKFDTPEEFFKSQTVEIAKNYLMKAKKTISTIKPL